MFCLYRHLNQLLDSAELYVLLRLSNPLLRYRTVYLILFLQIQWLKPFLLIRDCRYPLTRPRRRYAVSCRLYSRGVTSCSHSLVRWCAILATTIPRVTPSKYFCVPVSQYVSIVFRKNKLFLSCPRLSVGTVQNLKW